MRWINKTISCAVILSLCGGLCEARPRWMPHPKEKALVQMAILLDTSNSMDGLIEQAKSQLWRIVNDLTYATCRGERPTLQVALYEYGNDRLSPGENYVRQVLPFTTDLDQVSEKLFALRTNGGSEYCGAVIKDAVNGLAWDPRNDVYKVMFIAGNEPFTQGAVPYGESIAQAVRKGIYVNPIYCGVYHEGVETQWYAGAIAGRGSYLNIDHNISVVAVPTPYDPEIQALGDRLNRTYVGYRAAGRRGVAMIQEVDSLAASQAVAGAQTERALAKASPQSMNAPWDVVNQVSSGKKDLASIEREELPAELKNKSTAELGAYFEEQQSKRRSIQTRLTELKSSRDSYLLKSQAGQASGAPLSLDQAILKVIRQQGERFNFRFEGAR